MASFHAVIIGGGGTGAAVAHDLTLRGMKVTLIERGELTSGTTGRHHGLLHSGARYAVKDKESAVECIEENTILRRIAPGSFELNDGLFVALTDEEAAYSHELVEACYDCGIPAKRLTREEVLAREPNINPAVKLAVQVPDATMDAMISFGVSAVMRAPVFTKMRRPSTKALNDGSLTSTISMPELDRPAALRIGRA